MDAYNIELTNLVYQGGDDCIAIKPRSYNIYVRNVTCVGGNGIAIGSLGQYLEDSSVENVVVDNVTVSQKLSFKPSTYSCISAYRQIIRHNDDMTNSAYIKTWTGVLTPQSSYESAGLPRGGGWGSVTNILFSNFNVQGADSGPAISEDSGDNGTSPGTSKMLISNIAFVNFTGYTSNPKKSNVTSTISCSNVHPCYNIDFQNVNITPGQNGTGPGLGSCKYTAPGGVHGLPGC